MKENNEPIIVEISDIVEMTKHCEFFKKLNEEQGDEKIHHACCKAMKIEEYNPNDIIIKYGEPAACFYVVIDGKVSVRIPSKQKTLNHFNFIDSLNKDPFKKKLKFVPNHFDEKIGVSLLSTLLNFHGQYFEEVSVLGPGDVFGELAILSEKPRAATVQAKTKVVLGVLSKGAFQKLIGAFTEKKLNEKIEFLQSLSLFKSWSRLFLMRISFYFSYKKLSWNQILYKEGSPSNSIYFIKEGDIMVSRSIANSLESVNKLPKISALSKKVDLKLVKKSRGMILGLSEVIEESNIMGCTAYCCSSFAEVYILSRNDFDTKVTRPETWNILKKNYAESKSLLETCYKSSYLTEIAKLELSKNTFSVPIKKRKTVSKNNNVQTKVNLIPPIGMHSKHRNFSEAFLSDSNPRDFYNTSRARRSSIESIFKTAASTSSEID